jgi:succinate dehydrogenase/fumarate reductase-like Fe-S protein
MGRVHALFVLAWGLVRSLMAPVLGLRRGLEAFRRSYAADRLAPMSPEERRHLPAFSRCIACGLCDAGEGAAMARSSGRYAGVMDLMLSSSRSMPDYDAAARSFEAVGDSRLAVLEARCPARVPMRQVAAFVRAKAAEVAAVAPGAPARTSR